ncbi:peroxidase family protein [Amycolatopsis albispora]|nr:heme peroxidase family protein [Amycolatopsis albispora]
MHRHSRESYYVVGEGDLSFDAERNPVSSRPSARSELRRFRFSRLGPVGEQVDPALAQELAAAMTVEQDTSGAAPVEPVPAGFTYLGQFVDHDLTLDRTAVDFGEDVSLEDLIAGRSPALDLDALYGRGPERDRHLYTDGVHLKVGTTAAVPLDGANTNRTGFDLPRKGTGETKAEERSAVIPDARNDENLAVAQTHLAFIHFHNKVADVLAAEGVPPAQLFERARAEVVRHYQWLLRTDYLPRIADPAVVTEVFTNGRRFFEPAPDAHDAATMPIEFSVAAFRLGHSMARATYQWNRFFRAGAPAGIATMLQLFIFSGTSGTLSPTGNPADLDDPNAGTFLRLPTNWIVDWRRLHDFPGAGRPDLGVPEGEGNVARRIDTLLTNPLATLPAGTFDGRGQNLAPDDIQRNLAYRNLIRANMVKLASGQQMAAFFGVKELTGDELLSGDGQGANLAALSEEHREALVARTPLWFYILREAEVHGGKLGAVGATIVAEVFSRCMDAARYSILREPAWRPRFGTAEGRFGMADLLLFAFDGDPAKLNPLGDG